MLCMASQSGPFGETFTMRKIKCNLNQPAASLTIETFSALHEHVTNNEIEPIVVCFLSLTENKVLCCHYRLNMLKVTLFLLFHFCPCFAFCNCILPFTRNIKEHQYRSSSFGIFRTMKNTVDKPWPFFRHNLSTL